MDARKLGITAPHFLYKLQSDSFIRKTENRNFTDDKSITQWWYFDCMLDDGSLLVFLFTPYQWWSAHEKMPTHKSLVYVSYLKPNGELFTASETTNAADVLYMHNRIESSCFSLERAHEKGKRRYNVTFNMKDVQGTVKIDSDADAFSPFPGGKLIPWAAKNILKLKSESPLFRYAAHVPHGNARCDLRLGGNAAKLNGRAYHEQGMFRGSPHEMVPCWSWFHFASKSFNVFGTPLEFFCLEKNGQKKIGGFTFLDEGCVLSDVQYHGEQKHLITGGALNFRSSQLSYSITPSGSRTPMVVIPCFDSIQLWGTVAQQSTIRYTEKGETIEETGWLLLETCQMGR